MKPSGAGVWHEDWSHEPPRRVFTTEETRRKSHVVALAVSTALSREYVRTSVRPATVIDVLNAAGVRFVLAGAHGIGGWTGEPRTTQDVDVLVAARQVRAAVAALRAAFPRLVVKDTPVVTRFTDPRKGIVVLDVMKPNQPLHQVALRHAHRIETAKRTYNVPTLEFALALKFAAMVSHWRQRDKKLMDAADFLRIVEVNPAIDLAKLANLGERVYPGGGAEVLDMVRRVRAGEMLQL